MKQRLALARPHSTQSSALSVVLDLPSAIPASLLVVGLLAGIVVTSVVTAKALQGVRGPYAMAGNPGMLRLSASRSGRPMRGVFMGATLAAPVERPIAA
ncbi:hypothetical protein ACGFY9_21210 [Streptomyces sp. NPDC048504]|uniref:hypothetical protein n=1 Tax=Streptomyces sp. NPDC048504 TaxID=3365559 RepID=UPI00371EF289